MLKKVSNTLKQWFNGTKHFVKKQDRKTVITTVALLVIVIAWGVYYFKSNSDLSVLRFWESGDKKIAEKTINYINDNGLASSTASLVSVSRESGLIKIKIKIGETEFDSYISKDGKFLFPTVINMSEAEETEGKNTESTSTTSAATCDELAKTDKPVLEAYVVAACPYGLQMQRAMADAVASVPELANYLKVKYIGSADGNTISSMHGEEEAQENLRQICIRDEQSDKYWNYVSCFIKAGDSTGCLASSGVNTSTLSGCMSDSSRGVAYASADFSSANTYGVSGSPTLMVGSANIDESGFGGRSSDAVKEIVCCSSNSEPGFCSQTLNTASAATSYSENYSGSGSTSSASCN